MKIIDTEFICSLYKDAKDKDEEFKIILQLFPMTAVNLTKLLQEKGLMPCDKTKLYKRMRLFYDMGMTDLGIATQLSVPQSDIKAWRISLKLKPHITREGIKHD